MTPKERAAMQQALEALEKSHPISNSNKDLDAHSEAITALREALAEPQITTPDVCGEVCARAKLCYGCNKDLEAANAKYVEQAEQRSNSERMEPVAWFRYESTYEYQNKLSRCTKDCFGAFPVYAAPVRTKDLTDDEIERALDAAKVPELPDGYKSVDLEIARAVIAADREKNK